MLQRKATRHGVAFLLSKNEDHGNILKYPNRKKECLASAEHSFFLFINRISVMNIFIKYLFLYSHYSFVIYRFQDY